jgi:hypothetical protein
MDSIVISSLSTLIALVSLTISLLTYLERKPKLHFVFTYAHQGNNKGFFECKIFNLGHDVIILDEYGFTTEPKDPSDDVIGVRWVQMDKSGAPGTAKLQPHESHTFSFSFEYRKYTFKNFWVCDVAGKEYRINRHRLKTLNSLVGVKG